MDESKKFDELRSWRPATPNDDSWEAASGRARSRSRRRALVGGAIAVVALLGAYGTVTALNEGDEDAIDVIADSSTTTTEVVATTSAVPTTTAPAEGASGFADLGPGWHELDTGPVPPMFSAVAWGGGELFVVGDQGAFAYNPATETWRTLADPPPNETMSPAVVWTGGLLVMVSDTYRDPPTSATYDIKADTWSDLGPLPTNPTFQAAGLGVGTSGPSDPNNRTSLVFTGSHVVDATHGVKLDLDSGVWSPLPMPDDLIPYTALLYSNPVWTRVEVLAVYPIDKPGLAWTSHGGSFREVPGLPTQMMQGPRAVGPAFTIALDGSKIGFVLSDDLGSAFLLDTTTWTWSELPPVPGAAAGNGCPARAGAAGSLLVVAPCPHREPPYVGPPVYFDGQSWQGTGPQLVDASPYLGIWLNTGDALVSWESDTDTYNNPDAPYVRAQVWVPPT